MRRSVAISLAVAAVLAPVGVRADAARAIPFAHPLPAMDVRGLSSAKAGLRESNGTYNNVEFACPGLLTTTDAALGKFIWNLRKSIYADRRLVVADGVTMTCSPNWIRDHIHQMKAFRHWEYDLGSFYDFILNRQRADGQFYELVKQLDDFHWTFVSPDCCVKYPADNQALIRLEIEADVEYLMVEGAVRIWRVTGDDAWLKAVLPRLERGIEYQTSDPKRWDAERGLAKRAFTIDTWDFMDHVSNLAPLNRKIFPDTPMSVMHGDNSGLYQAMVQLAWMNERVGREKVGVESRCRGEKVKVEGEGEQWNWSSFGRAAMWRGRAAALKASMMKHLWNGRFFIHQLHVNHRGIDGRERERLSLSNAYALNRGLLTLGERRAVIGEYLRRRETTGAFAEWFSIDPPYPKFGAYRRGDYVNGGISPFTAGELALGAFCSGYEDYGYGIVTRLRKMYERDDGIYFLYTPGDAKPLGGGPSGWGSAAVLNAIDEGLAGIVDIGCGYSAIAFSPRWPVTEYTELRYLTGYESTKAFVDCRYVLTENGMRYSLSSPARRIVAHLLVPKGRTVARLLVNGVETSFAVSRPGEYDYVDVTTSANGIVDFEVLFLK